MNTGKIKLSHSSVKQYLLSTSVDEYFSINEQASHSTISKLSIAYLLQFDDSFPLTVDTFHSMPLAQYAAEHWIDHVKSGGIDPTVMQLILRLFTSESAPLKNWIRMYNIDFGGYTEQAEVCSALYYSSLAGMQEVTVCLLHKGENVNEVGGRFGNALQAASHGGYEEIVKLLLENGAEVNAEGGEYGNALQGASFRGDQVIVKLLLENGAEVNAEGGEFGYALQAASFGGSEMIVKLLLENGANVNAKGGKYGNALQAASFGGSEMIVKLLLENGANVNAKGGKYGNALQAASYHLYHEEYEIVKLLLENGAEVNAEGGEFGYALQAASFGGTEMIVKLLLENGANVNAKGGKFGNALQAASYNEGYKIVKLLLKNGADINAEGGMFGNALQAASIRGNEMIVKLLLENGANVNAKGGKYENALQAALSRDGEALVKLLEKGTEVRAEGYKMSEHFCKPYFLNCQLLVPPQHFLGITTSWIAAEHALQHARNKILSVSKVFDKWQIQKSDYAVLAGFDESLIKSGVGYLEQIHIFVIAEVDPSHSLLTELGKLFSPFSSILFTESSSYRLPAFKKDGSVWEFDELVYFAASKSADGGSSSKTTPSQADGTTRSSQNNSGSEEGEKDKKSEKGKDSERDKGDPEEADKGNNDPSGNPDNPPEDQDGIIAGPVEIIVKINSEIHLIQKHPDPFQTLTMQGKLTIEVLLYFLLHCVTV